MGLLSLLRHPRAVTAIALPPSPTEEVEEKDVLKEKDGSLADIPTLSITQDVESDNAALDVVADMLYRACWPLGWIPFQQVESEQWLDEVVLGVSIRGDSGTVRSCPAEHEGLRMFEAGVAMLHATVAIKFTCKAVEYMVKYYL